MSHSTLRHSVIIAAHAIVGWALCAVTMGLGIAAAGLHSALIIHAVAAPIIFTNISALYFARFRTEGKDGIALNGIRICVILLSPS